MMMQLANVYYTLLATANRTAEFLGVEVHTKRMTEQALADGFEEATWMTETPTPDLNYIGCYALSELVREKGFRVLINGMLDIPSSSSFSVSSSSSSAIQIQY